MLFRSDVFNKLILNFIHNASEFGAEPQLRALFVNKVDKDLLPVLFLDLFDVFLRKLDRFIMILIDDNSWAPFHCWLLTPKSWDRSSGLNVSGNSHGIT